MSSPLVKTTYGKVEGLEQGAITVWQGIPFARTPIARRRFSHLNQRCRGPACLMRLSLDRLRSKPRVWGLLPPSVSVLAARTA